MWFHSARKHPAVRALATLLVAFVCGSALDWGHRVGDDVDGSPALVHHDHSAHRIHRDASGAPQAPDHCYICHSLRLLHSALTASAGCVAASATSRQFAFAADIVVATAPRIAQTSRAPPAAFL